MIKIIHTADWHLHNNKRHEEYDAVFNKFYQKLDELKPNIVCIVGDLYNDFIEVSHENSLICSNFLNEITKRCDELIITYGNHDCRKKSKDRLNSVETIVKLIKNPKITYFGTSGFFQDQYFKEIVWVNHAHLEKTTNPWNSPNYSNDNNKIYIDLFHDPIYGCKTDDKVFISDQYSKISDFLGDLVLLGDIHKFQYLREDKTAAYSSSPIQQNFGESVDKHGFIEWNISKNIIFNCESKFHELTNDYAFINIYLNEQTDYDNLKIDINNPVKNIEIKVHWNDYAANINLENESKIRDHLKKYTDKIKFDKKYIYIKISDSEKFTDNVDVTDVAIQQSIIREYLSKNGYDDKVIEEIIRIDNLVNSQLERIEYKTNITWSIDKMWFNNFKSYGPNNIIEWENKNGIIQLKGKNQHGKTTILDLITYVLYGTTLATNKLGGGKVEKHGDNRYINNKRKIDYCDGGMTINANGEIYTLYRRTERTWTRGKTLSSVSTNFDVYEGPEMVEDKKLNGERKSKTQQRISAIIGEFDDFVRLALTNADNLNDLLSLNRATFLDNVLKDAGFDIFEEKNEILKDYKKKLAETKINNFNVTEELENITTLKASIKLKEEEILDFTKQLTTIDEGIERLIEEKESHIKRLHQVDENIASININEVNEAIDKYKSNITNLKLKFNSNLTEIKELHSEYDEQELNDLYISKKKKEDTINEQSLTLSQYDNQISNHTHNISTYKNNIESIKKDFIQDNNNKINEIKYQVTEKETEIKSIWKEKESDLRLQYKDIETELSLKNLELKNIKEQGVELKKKIEEFKNSSVCPACNREYDNVEDIKVHIEHETTILNGLFEKVKPIQESIKKIEEKKEKLALKINSVVQQNLDEFTDVSEKVQAIKSEIVKLTKKTETLKSLNESIKQEQYTGEIEDKITNELSNIESELKNIKIIENIKKEQLSNIEKIKDEILLIEQDIIDLEAIKEAVKRHNFLRDENEKIKMQLENYKLQIASFNSKLELYNIQLQWIEENKLIENTIQKLKDKIDEESEKSEELTNSINNHKREITYDNKEIEGKKKLIAQVKEYEKKEEMIKEYGKAIHRDGIPTYLLQKSIYLINNELSSLLTDVDFIVYFDENLNLKMSPINRLDVVQNAIECSGKERTFIACSLKLALRNVNNKSKPNFILFDEITGKLYENSVEEFFAFLSCAKNKIEKIIIIEHVHPVDYDYIITVEKDASGISSLSMS